MYFILQRIGSGHYFKRLGDAGNHELAADVQEAKLFAATIKDGQLVVKGEGLPEGTDNDYLPKSVQVHLR